MAKQKSRNGRGGVRPGAGRPPLLDDPVQMRIMIERRDHEALNALAQERGVSAMELARRAIRQLLRRYRR